MGHYTVIEATKEQQDVLLKKHLKAQPLTFIKKLIGRKYPNATVSKKFSYDSDDNIGFVTLLLSSGKTCSYQLRGNTPCFVEFTGFDSIRYDISYPKGEIFDILHYEGIQARNNFWKGGQI